MAELIGRWPDADFSDYELADYRTLFAEHEPDDVRTVMGQVKRDYSSRKPALKWFVDRLERIAARKPKKVASDFPERMLPMSDMRMALAKTADAIIEVVKRDTLRRWTVEMKWYFGGGENWATEGPLASDNPFDWPDALVREVHHYVRVFQLFNWQQPAATT